MRQLNGWYVLKSKSLRRTAGFLSDGRAESETDNHQSCAETHGKAEYRTVNLHIVHELSMDLLCVINVVYLVRELFPTLLIHDLPSEKSGGRGHMAGPMAAGSRESGLPCGEGVNVRALPDSWLPIDFLFLALAAPVMEGGGGRRFEAADQPSLERVQYVSNKEKYTEPLRHATRNGALAKVPAKTTLSIL
jgi:hypothetical protein